MQTKVWDLKDTRRSRRQRLIPYDTLTVTR